MAAKRVSRKSPGKKAGLLPSLTVKNMPRPGKSATAAWKHLAKLIKKLQARVDKVTAAIPMNKIAGAPKKQTAAESLPPECWPTEMAYGPCSFDETKTCRITMWECDDGSRFTTEELV